MRFVVIFLLVLTSAACSRLPQLPTFGFNRAVPEITLPYRARVQAARSSRAFVVSVDQGAASTDDVRESVRFPATRRCITQFGSSEIAWDLNAQQQDWAVSRNERGQAFYSGRCTGR